MDEHDAAIDSAARMHGDTPNWSFHVQDYVHESLPKADLLVSRAALLVDPPLHCKIFHVSQQSQRLLSQINTFDWV